MNSSSCGNGFWESTGNGKYEYPGVDAHAENMQIGDEVGSNVKVVVNGKTCKRVPDIRNRIQEILLWLNISVMWL